MARPRKRAASPDTEDVVDLKKPQQNKKSKATAESKNNATDKASSEPKQDKDQLLEESERNYGTTQVAKADGLLIQADRQLNLPFQIHVYIDEDRIIYDASLNQTNSSGNNNKFYKIQLVTNDLGGFWTWTRWGRVGDQGQTERLGDGSLESALVFFEKKFKDKTGLRWKDRLEGPKPKKYVFLERVYEEDSDQDTEASQQASKAAKDEEPIPECTLALPVQSLMKFIFNQKHIDQAMAEMNYNVNKLPLGKLSRSTILRGYQALKDLATLFANRDLAHSVHHTDYENAVEQLSNRYYSYIPHDFRRDRPPQIQQQEHLEREVALLESLTELKDTDTIMRANKGKEGDTINAHYEALHLQEMTPIDKESTEYSSIHGYLEESRGKFHHLDYDLQDVFRIERQGERERFKQVEQDKSDRRLLWHGSRSTNFGGILSQGLRIAPPEAPVSGYMFGKGVYLADMSSKSANYCHHYISNNEGLLLLCEAELGSPMQELTHSSSEAGEQAKAKNMLSTWGKGGHGPAVWKDAGCIHPDLKGVRMPDTAHGTGRLDVTDTSLDYNEYICYDVSQIRLRYLLRFTIRNG